MSGAQSRTSEADHHKRGGSRAQELPRRRVSVTRISVVISPSAWRQNVNARRRKVKAAHAVTAGGAGVTIGLTRPKKTRRAGC